MPYTNKDRILIVISVSDLTKLCDPDKNGAVDETVLGRAIDKADIILNNSGGAGGYVVPFAPVPEYIAYLATDLVVYELKRNKNLGVEDDGLDRFYKKIQAELSKLEKGIFKFETNVSTQSNAPLLVTNADTSPIVFTDSFFDEIKSK
jgi:phage gp36-like protein